MFRFSLQDFLEGIAGGLLSFLLGRRFRTKVIDFTGTISSAPSQDSLALVVFFFETVEDAFCAIPKLETEKTNEIVKTNRIRIFTR